MFKKLDFNPAKHFITFEQAQQTKWPGHEGEFTRADYDRMIEECGPQPIEELGEGFYSRHPEFNLCGPGQAVVWDTDLTEFSETGDPFDWNAYGVVDSPSQFMELIGNKIKASQRWFAVEMYTICKADQPPQQGWRFHKHGPWYGKQKREGYEYLYDEPHISEVWCFHIYEIPSPINSQPQERREVFRAQVGLPADPPRNQPTYQGSSQ